MPRLIPVLDLRRGRVVRAVRGERERYAPVRSVLVRGSEPRRVLAALLRLAPFDTVYLADLDAIQGGRPQRRLLAALCRAHPRAEFWIDSGPPPARPLPANARAVLGTEFLAADARLPPGAVLSLDFDAGGLRGADDAWLEPRRWPPRVIAMCLHRVGSGAGPDWALLDRLRRGGARPAAAGGVRDARDARLLFRRRLDVLAASVLHRARPRAAELARLGAAQLRTRRSRRAAGAGRSRPSSGRWK